MPTSAAMSERREAKTSTPSRLGRKITVTLVLAVLVFAVLSVVSDVRALGESLSRFESRAFFVGLALVLGNYALRFVRWQYYLNVLAIQGVPIGQSLLVFLSGFLMSVTPGKMGEVFKSLLLHDYRGVGVSRTASIVVAERMTDLVALVLLVAVSSVSFEHGRAITVLGALFVLSIVLFATVRSLAMWFFDRLEEVRPLARIVPRLREAYEALYVLTRPRPFVVGGLFALFGWGLECLATYEIVRGFHDTESSLLGASFAYAAGTLAGALAMLPGGLGVAELGMTGLLRAVSEQITPATAAAATILVRLATLWFGVALGGLALIFLRTVGQRRQG